jgi:hypothetical protein
MSEYKKGMYNIQSNLSYVTFQGNSEIWSHKTGFIDMKCAVREIKIKVSQYKLLLNNRGGH